MKTVGQHLILDLYTSSKAPLNDALAIQNMLTQLATNLTIAPLGMQCQALPTGGVIGYLLLTEGQLALRTCPDFSFVALDFFLEPDILDEKTLIQFFKKNLFAEKIKMTHVKRGDQGTLADMKPKSSTSSGPLRKVKDTSRRVIRLLKPNKSKE